MIFYMVMNDMCALAGVALFVSVGALTCVSVNSSVTKKTGKPNMGRGTLDIESVFGKPVQELTVKWTALQSNMSRYRLFVGRMVQYHCRILKKAICIRVSRKKGESFSCYIGKDVLGQLFQWHELTEERACVKDQHAWCDGFCVNLTSQTYLGTKACDAQSCPLVSSYLSWWRLLLEAKCQSPRNLSVTFRKDHTMVISWLPPPLVWKNSTIYYVLYYNVTNILNETIFQTDSFDIGKNKLNYTLTNVQSFSKYGISVGCRYSMLRPLGSSPGPHIYKEFTSLEEVPSESPKCEVLNRTMSGTALILLKPPPKSSWNGIPTRYVLFYDNGEEENYSLNISLQGVNEIKVWVNYTDVNKSRAVKTTICNGAGCRRSLGQPCFIDGVDIPEIKNKGWSNFLEFGSVMFFFQSGGGGGGRGWLSLGSWLLLSSNLQVD
ncbi:uncharacterized protein [Montipora foliosa]|uniref:uncharacterized protein n=1 Tax=Montipora foliosa TaxID=591990 RepID=UPI0035F10D02